MEQLKFHPVSEIFPSMPQAEFDALVADITANGLREPIHIMGDSVVDGRHRYRACLQAGVEPQFVVVPDGTDLNALVISLNLRRRHLNESQRSMVAARLETRDLGRPHKDANLHHLPISRAHVSELLNVSTRSVANAAKVLQDGAPELIDAIERGAVAVSTGADLARLPVDTQREALGRTPQEIRAIAQDVGNRIQSAGVVGQSAVRIFDEVAQETGLDGAQQLAVVQVLKDQATPLPTPMEAKRIASEGAKGLLVLGSDGCYHTAPGDPDENARMQQWLNLREGLEPLAKLKFSANEAFASIPPYQQKNVTDWLSSAVPYLNQLNSLWSQAHA
jgi:ParB-like chromosome segregation protein Spo0J